ncbi:MAG: hypothetical protein R6W96_05100 [Clostridia bacterium]
MKTLKKFIIYILFPAAILLLSMLGDALALIAVIILYMAVFLLLEKENILKLMASHQFKKKNNLKALRYIYKAYRMKRSGIHTAVTFIYFLLKSGKYEKAGEIIVETEKRTLTPQEKNSLSLNKALFLWKTDRILESLELYGQLAVDDESTSLYSSYGYVATLVDDPEKALGVNLKAFEYNPESSAILDNLGLVYLKANDLDKAQEIYDRLMEKEPRFPEAYYNMSLLMERRYDMDESIYYLKKALEQDFDGLTTISREDVEKKLAHLKKLYGKAL